MARCSCKKNSRKRRVRTKKQRKMKRNSSKKYQKKRRSQSGGGMFSGIIGYLRGTTPPTEPTVPAVPTVPTVPTKQDQLVPPLSTTDTTTNVVEAQKLLENVNCVSITNGADCKATTNCELNGEVCQKKTGQAAQVDGNNLGSPAPLAAPAGVGGKKKRKKTKGKKKK